MFAQGSPGSPGLEAEVSAFPIPNTQKHQWEGRGFRLQPSRPPLPPHSPRWPCRGWTEPRGTPAAAAVSPAPREPSGGDGWRRRAASPVVRRAAGVLKDRGLVLSSSSLSPRPPAFSLIPSVLNVIYPEPSPASQAGGAGWPDGSSWERRARGPGPACGRAAAGPRGRRAAPARAGGGGRAEPAAGQDAAPGCLPQPAEPQPMGGRPEHLRAGVPGRPGERGGCGGGGQQQGLGGIPRSPKEMLWGAGPVPGGTAGSVVSVPTQPCCSFAP